MKPIEIIFSKGTQFPPKLGTLILKPTTPGKASYTQNIDVSSDEYGNSSIVPGPALTAITNNSELTGVPAFRQFYGENISPQGYLWFSQGLLGSASNVVRRIKNIVSGSTPQIDTGTSVTISPGGTNPTITDLTRRVVTSTELIYVAIKDDTASYVYSFDASDGTGSTLRATIAGWTGGFTDPILVYSTFDNNIYIIGQNRVDSLSIAHSQTINALALGLPLSTYATAAVDWQQQLVVASSSNKYGLFSTRKSGGRANLAIWDYVSPGITRNIPAPCRHISALVPTPDGTLLVFGGVDEGKSSIYQFTGYGFNLITQYIGDMPRSRHSVEFDGQGRIVWLTADGFLCRYDRSSGVFENLGRTYSTGGLLAKGIGSPIGNEFFVGVGQGTTYEMDIVSFGTYAGDNNGTDSTNTPMAISGTEILPPGTTIAAATLNLNKPLETGEKVILRIYKNGSITDYVDYLTMEYSADGAISSKREVKTLENINVFHVAAVYKMTSGSATAPPVLSVTIEPESVLN
jgi:hypothetical protein